MGQKSLLAILLLGLFLRVLYAVGIYDDSLMPYHGGDWTEYALAAEQIVGGDFSFSSSYFVVRPPLFPLMIALLDMRPFLIIGTNILLATAIIPLTFSIALSLGFSQALALLAAAIVAIDLTSIKYSGVMVAEPLANLLLALGFLSLLSLRRARSATVIVITGLLCGACFALSALARPASFLLWIPLAAWLAIVRGGGEDSGCSLFPYPTDTGRRRLESTQRISLQ